ncbi:substance-K receptor-like [Paramacrobiotus metropolitanus]|uniref:substance-K receptor-like n=1 Tax=Paramacrobiotus metropolitanus TaxID=2943436 RepID=UPI0024461D31|nr:substance-K receptor-like [Paramacrobiotus metropolitanus]
MDSDVCENAPNILLEWEKFTMVLVYEFPVVLMTASWVYIAYKRRLQRRILSRVATAHETMEGHHTHHHHKSVGFLVLTFLLVSAIVCWTPYETYYVLFTFGIIEENPKLISITLALYIVQPALDPVLIILTTSDLRRWIKETVVKCI